MTETSRALGPLTARKVPPGVLAGPITPTMLRLALPTIIVLVSYAAAFYLLSQTLHTIPVAVAYAVWSGAGVALITLIAWAMFGQRLDAVALLGIALIVAGVLVIRILSNASAH